jgi:hypothetical protein
MVISDVVFVLEAGFFVLSFALGLLAGLLA